MAITQETYAENDTDVVTRIRNVLNLPSSTIRRALRKAKIANNYCTTLYSEDEKSATIFWNLVRCTYTVTFRD